jgi:hypothetical protein
MTQSTKEDLLNKWAPILDKIGVTSSSANWLSEYAEMQAISDISSNNTSTIDNTSTSFPTMLPIVKRIFAKTVGIDLVSVQPIGGISIDKLDEIKKEVKTENRDRKIDSIVDGKDFEEMKVEDHPDFKSDSPTGNLFYMDYKYDSSTQSNSIL